MGERPGMMLRRLRFRRGRKFRSSMRVTSTPTPLRQLTKDQRNTVLFKPQTALHIRWSLNTDTPLPPDEPAGENPPDGAMIDYFLTEESPVTLEIKDNKGNLVRRYSSADLPVL